MNEQGYETLKRFGEKVNKLSPSERKKIEKMVGEHKTFIGAAWVYFNTLKTPTPKTPTLKTPTPKTPTLKTPTLKTPKTKSTATKEGKLTPYVKELEPGIKTIHFKKL
jgi:hypothetical protein